MPPKSASLDELRPSAGSGRREPVERRQADGTLGYSPKLRHGEIGKGLNDYDAIFSILRDLRYAGWISIEDGDTMDSMRNSVAFLKRMRHQYFGA